MADPAPTPEPAKPGRPAPPPPDPRTVLASCLAAAAVAFLGKFVEVTGTFPAAGPAPPASASPQAPPARETPAPAAAVSHVYHHHEGEVRHLIVVPGSPAAPITVPTATPVIVPGASDAEAAAPPEPAPATAPARAEP